MTVLWPEALDIGPTGVGFRDAAEVDVLPPCVPVTVQVTFYDIVGQYVVNRLGAVETEYTGEADPDAAPRPAEAHACSRLLTIVVDGDRPITDDDVDILLLPDDGGPVTFGLDRDDIVTAWYDAPPESAEC